MGIFKAIGKFFETMDAETKPQTQVPVKSPEELAKEAARQKEREKYTQEYQLRRSVEKLEDSVSELQSEAAVQWKKAKAFEEQGQHLMAENQLSAWRLTMNQIKQIQFAAISCKAKMLSLQSAGSVVDVTKLLGQYAKMCGMDMSPADVDEAMSNIDLATAPIDEINKVFQKQMSRDDRKAREQSQEENSVEDSAEMRILQAEIAGEMAAKNDSPTPQTAGTKDTAENVSSQDAEIDAGLREVQQLMNDMEK